MQQPIRVLCSEERANLETALDNEIAAAAWERAQLLEENRALRFELAATRWALEKALVENARLAGDVDDAIESAGRQEQPAAPLVLEHDCIEAA